MFDTKAKLKDMIAQESARIIAEQGFENFSAAKAKAAKFLNVEKKGCLPNNSEVERKLIQHYKIFHYKSHSNLIYSMRSIALIIMQLFNNYQPFLVGSVANGTASKSSKINIHLTSDNLEEIIHVLEKNKIFYKSCERQLKINKKINKKYMGLELNYHNSNIELTIFSYRESKHAPISRIDNKPMKRIKIKKLEKLLAHSLPAI